MTKLEQLIEELCPNGVEYVSLGTVCTIAKGVQFNKADMNDVGTYPVINGGINPSGYIEQYNQDENTITISQGGASAGYVNWLEAKFWAGAHCYVLKPKANVLNRYAYHFVKSQERKLQECQYGAGIPALAKGTVESLSIPVPPLPVQSEIVRILDNFTELTAELTARKKQYEYYRDNLLTFDATIKQVRLGDICSVITKGTTPKSYTKTGVSFVKTEAFDGTRIVPEKLSYVDEETHTTFLRRSILEENDILVTIAGATIGKCAMVPKEILPANTNQALAIIRLAKGNSPKYVMYLLQSDLMKQYMQKNIKGSAQPNLNLKQLNDFIIPLPPLSVQERLVHVLDNFEAICSDLNIGLPAEIEARQKQYAFYRDALLTYAATGKTILTDRQTDRQTSLMA